MEVRPLGAADRPDVEALVDVALGGRLQVRLGAAVDVGELAGHGAWIDGALVGVALLRAAGKTELEVAAVCVSRDHRRRGVGTALLHAAVGAATGAGATRIWLVTTNDNLEALALYQLAGFRLAELHVGAVDRARAELKPEIPELGDHGIPRRDELVLERLLP